MFCIDWQSKKSAKLRRVSDARSCPHADINSAKIFSVSYRRLSERKEFDLGSAKYTEQAKNFVGQKFWARGYFVSTVGADEKVIKDYIKNQESDDRKMEQLNLFNR